MFAPQLLLRLLHLRRPPRQVVPAKASLRLTLTTSLLLVQWLPQQLQLVLVLSMLQWLLDREMRALQGHVVTTTKMPRQQQTMLANYTRLREAGHHRLTRRSRCSQIRRHLHPCLRSISNPPYVGERRATRVTYSMATTLMEDARHLEPCLPLSQCILLQRRQPIHTAPPLP